MSIGKLARLLVFVQGNDIVNMVVSPLVVIDRMALVFLDQSTDILVVNGNLKDMLSVCRQLKHFKDPYPVSVCSGSPLEPLLFIFLPNGTPVKGRRAIGQRLQNVTRKIVNRP